MTRLRTAILALAVVNATLYSALLPLWEGFDEPAHYGYVERLRTTRRFPQLLRTNFPADVVASFSLAPGSYLMHRWLPQTLPYEDWFALPAVDRERRRAALDLVQPSGDAPGQLNYEAHHPPLAYLPLAALDGALSGRPLAARVLILRLFAALAATLLVFFGALRLARELALPDDFTSALLFLVFCSQMFYAATAHITNDWLAIPLAVWFFALLAAFRNSPDLRGALAASAVLALGLLTKAYFLAFGGAAFLVAGWLLYRRAVRLRPLAISAVLAIAVAGPWYVRNLAVYHNLSGTYEATTGVDVGKALGAARRVDWLTTAGSLARGSLWMGNNSGTSFSRLTLNMLLVALFLAIAAWAARASLIRPAERTTFTAIAVFIAAIAYATCSAFACDACGFRQPSPWYTQILLVPVFALACLGLSRWRRPGAALASALIVLWTWLLAATWMVKLFPMYSGAGAAPMRVAVLLHWYTHEASARAADFSLTALAPASVLYTGLVISIALTLVLAGALIRNLLRASRV